MLYLCLCSLVSIDYSVLGTDRPILEFIALLELANFGLSEGRGFRGYETGFLCQLTDH